MRTRTWLLFVLVLVGPVQAAELKDPPPIPVPVGISQADVATAIKKALAGRKLTVDSEQPGHIVARYAPRTHVARMTISYDTSQVRIAYLDSINLDYEEQGSRREVYRSPRGDTDVRVIPAHRQIHRNYNKWVANIAHDIQQQLYR